ncbi:MAG: YjbQ family protein [Elusimicrobia bacterium]|nr:YjbQ family protein [Elusimicrobiota bacterium]
MWIQREIRLRPRSRGFHLVTRDVVAELPELKEIAIGLAHFFIRHTSASLCLNENADPDVRADFETYFNHAVPGSGISFRHTTEGADDMPSHLKAALLGAGVTVPIRNGELALGTWQGLYLGEHRDHGGERRLIATLWGTAPARTGGDGRGSDR